MDESTANGRIRDASQCQGSVHCQPRCHRFVDERGERWVVRQATADGHDSLVAIYDDFSAASRTMGLPPRTTARIETWVAGLLDEGVNVVAACDGRIVGHAFYTPSDDPEPEFGVFVHGDHRNRGIGTEVSKHVVATAAAADREALTLEVARENWAARDLYDALGFEVVDQFSYDLEERSAGSLGMRLRLTNDAAVEAGSAPAFEAD